jgi:asparagine synthase (glutamine-hydrolysing)
MCGINGIYGLDYDKAAKIVSAMNNSLLHRGPDANKLYSDENIALGHTRLSIIDTSDRANQPFIDPDSGLVIVFNGEIYNYEELKCELDYEWLTSSDTEVILAYYKKYGVSCLDRFNGMFAFAIWDKVKKELFIARDRLGVKPLYYQFLGKNQLIFSSELRPILRSGLVRKKISHDGISDFLRNLSVKCPNTILDVKQLEPGHYLLFKNNDVVKIQYWSISEQFKMAAAKQDKLTIQKRVKAFVENSVKSRMVADVPVGAFLSGGIDSSIIVGVMSQFAKERIHTFSIGFENQEFDESKYARQVSSKFNTIHHETILKPEYVLEILPEYLRNMDSPTLDGINTYIVSKIAAQQGIKVVLSGLGGDELFGGYPGFRRWQKCKQLLALLKHKPVLSGLNIGTKLVLNGRLKNKLENLLTSDKPYLFSRFYNGLRSSFQDVEINKVLNSDSRDVYNTWIDLDALVTNKNLTYSQYSIAELTNYTLDVLLKDADQMSMASALELREPFFDFKLIEFVLSVPDDIKNNNNQIKSLLIESFDGLLPKEVYDRPKMGFSFPWEKWLKNDLKDFCSNSVASFSNRPEFNENNVLNMWNDFLNNRNNIKWGHIWAMVVLDNWLQINVD